MPGAADPTFAGLAARAVRNLAARQVELAIAASLGVARWAFARPLGPAGLAVTDLAGLVVLAALVGIGPARRAVFSWLARRSRRRSWQHALDILWPPPTTPRITRHGVTVHGDWVRVRLGPGGTVTNLAGGAEAVAAWLDAREVRVQPDPATAGRATLVGLHTDPLEGPATVWPGTRVAQGSLWQPVPVGIDDNGNHITLGVAGHNLLVGGEPGAGKSVAVSQLVAATALDPAATLWLLDGKLVELAAWKPVAAGTAGIPIGEGIDLLGQVQAVMDERYTSLLDAGLRKVRPGTGLHVVVIDELAHYLTWPERKARDRFADLLRDLVARGRAAGVVVIAATQKPSADVIPTSLRDLFGYRWAFRCTTPAASDTILGTGWATNGTTASSIPPAARGVGWLIHETGVPVRLRAHHLDDPTVATIAKRASRLRQQPPSQGER